MNYNILLLVLVLTLSLTLLFSGCVSNLNKNVDYNLDNNNQVSICAKPCHLNLEDKDAKCFFAKEPLMCTKEYRISDICLSKIDCQIVNNNCETIDLGLNKCLDCVAECNKQESIDAFICAEKCISNRD